MRIAYLVPEFPAQTHVFFWREIQALKRIGASVHLLSTRHPQQLSRHAFAAAAQKETHYLFPPPLPSSLFYLALHPLLFLRMLQYILRVENTALKDKLKLIGLCLCAADLLRYASQHQIDHVHGHSCANVGHLLALASLSKQLPFSLTLHGDLPVYGTGHRAKFAEARFVAVVTYALQKQVQDALGFPISFLPVIRMGVDVDRFKPIAQTAEGPLQLITVARLAACKGHVYALRAMRAAIDQGAAVEYSIVGEGEMRAELEAEILALGLTGKARLLGTAGEDEVLAFLQKADAFVLSSVGLGEAAPVSVMEAMACGLPVISSIIGGTPEMIQPGEDGYLIAQEDVAGLARAFVELARDRELRQRLGQQARLKAVKSFSAQMFAQQFYDKIQQSAQGQSVS